MQLVVAFLVVWCTFKTVKKPMLPWIQNLQKALAARGCGSHSMLQSNIWHNEDAFVRDSNSPCSQATEIPQWPCKISTHINRVSEHNCLLALSVSDKRWKKLTIQKMLQARRLRDFQIHVVSSLEELPKGPLSGLGDRGLPSPTPAIPSKL